MNVSEGKHLTEKQLLSLTRYVNITALAAIFCVPTLTACGAADFFATTWNVLFKGKGMQIVLVWLMVFFDKFYISIAVNFFLWKRGRVKEFKPFKHPLGRATLKKIEYLPDEDKVGYGHLISFVFLPTSIMAVSLGWFLMAKNHCP